ncbi:hypothetical protein IU486_16385 [Streptomyces gardneri]|uniref:hypothetical protein n=1 Tax=Nocardia sputi TaxID=2943705 RepID=UPI001894D64D|nr:hypothetical protein [Nocardia sputi]MBF6166322.1 hypothetical protein [Streptomyces gardneri]
MLPPNVSAGACAWFRQAVHDIDPQIWDSWWASLERRVNDGTDVMWHEPWPHDYWVAQGIRYSTIGFAIQTWSQRGPLDDWPLLEAERTGMVPVDLGRTSNSAALDDVVAEAEPLDYRRAECLDRLIPLLRDDEPQQDGRPTQRMLQAEFVRAWLSSITGSALSGLLFAETTDADLLYQETLQRIEQVLEIVEWVDQPQIDLARAIEAWYAAQWHDLQPSLVPTQQGQPLWWRDHWFWLAHAWEREALREAIHLVAELLVCPPLLAAVGLVATRDGPVNALGLCVLRRCALGLRALAWLEEAISHPWQDVRLADIVLFAFSAVAPWWPRPSLAISHRSGDVKPTLLTLGLWGAAHVSIDAVTVPAGETNSGMVWRLFAAAPVIARVRSSRYGGSLWCRREAELTQYLRDRSDFLRGRVVADLTVSSLTAVDQEFAARRLLQDRAGRRTPEFPPNTLVIDVPSVPRLLVDVFAAVCTLRLLVGLLRDVDTVNRIADDLFTDQLITIAPPTNHPLGWAMHRAAFRALPGYGRKHQRSPVRLARDYPPAEFALDVQEVVDRVPDLSRCWTADTDLLAALEWNREIRRWFSDRWDSQRVVIDCRPLDAAAFAADPSHAIKRGMLRLRTEAIVFLIQQAEQAVDVWPTMKEFDPPILTVYLPDQLRWLGQALMLPTWVVAYCSLPTLEFAPSLVDAMFAALADQFAAHPSLPAPANYSDVFALGIGPESPLYETLKMVREDEEEPPS